MRYFTSFLAISLFIATLFTSQHGKASHLLGADITYDNVGTDSFLVDLTIYRDCSGGSLISTDINLGCRSSGSLNNFTKKQIGTATVTDITPTCDTGCSQCSNTSCNFQYGIEKHEYTYLVDLSNTNCCQVRFSYQNCCRSNKITTGLANDNYYTYTWFDRCNAPANSSPSFQREPFTIGCKDQNTLYNPGATDTDKDSTGNLLDSLNHTFTQPLGTGPNDTLTYNGGYTYKEPFNIRGGSPGLPFPFGFHLDHWTGDLRFTPTKEQVSVLSLKVQEYRDTNNNGNKDVIIGATKRDVQTFIIKCPNNKAPTITGMECPKQKYYKEICAGSKNTFTFCANDKNSPDTSTLDFAQGNLPDSANWEIKDTTAQNQKGQLTWEPTQNQVSDLPYIFTVKVSDNNCYTRGTGTQAYQIKVNPEIKANYQVKKLECGKVRFTAQAIQGKNPTFRWQGPGGLDQKGDTVKYAYDTGGRYPVTLTYSANNCQKTFYDTVEIDDFLRVNLRNTDTTLICKGKDFILGGQVRNASGPLTYTWHDSLKPQPKRVFNNLKQDSLLYLTVQDTVCSASDSLKVNVKNPPAIDLGADSQRTCITDSLLLKADGQYASYQWNTGDTTSQIYADTQSLHELTVKDTLGCSTSDSVSLVSLDTMVTQIRKDTCNAFTWSISGKTYQQSGTYLGYQNNPEYCDSSQPYQLNLTIRDSSHSQIKDTGCHSYTVPSGDETYYQGGVYHDTIPNQANCDSIITIDLAINPTNTTTDSALACNQYTWPVTGKTYDSTGVYYDTLSNRFGCDSIHQLYLGISDSSRYPIAITSCDSFMLPSGDTTYQNSGVYKDTLSTIKGCDSILTVDLTVVNIDTGLSQNGQTLKANQSSGSYQWLACDDQYQVVQGAAQRSFQPDSTGRYAVAMTDKGCNDTSNCRSVNTVGLLSNDFNTAIDFYPNPTTQTITIDLGKMYQSIKVKVARMQGKKVYTKTFRQAKEFRLPLNGKEGYYLVKLSTASGAEAKLKVLKLK